MKPDARKLIQKAHRAILAAGLLADADEFDFAAGRAYYAMFYAAEALLIEENFSFRKHSGVHAAFGERFAKTGRMNAKYHRWLLDAFDKRLQGDYGFDAVLTIDDVTQMMQQAREFVAAVTAQLGGTD